MPTPKFEIIDPAKYKQLFLDDHAIENLKGIRRILHQPKKHGPVIQPDRSKDQTLVQSSTCPNWNPEINRWEWWYSGFYDDAPDQGPGEAVWADYH